MFGIARYTIVTSVALAIAKGLVATDVSSTEDCTVKLAGKGHHGFIDRAIKSWPIHHDLDSVVQGKLGNVAIPATTKRACPFNFKRQLATGRLHSAAVVRHREGSAATSQLLPAATRRQSGLLALAAVFAKLISATEHAVMAAEDTDSMCSVRLLQLQGGMSPEDAPASLTVRLSQKSEGGGGAMVPVLWDELVPFGETKRKLQVRIYSKNDPKNPNVATEIGRTYPEDFGDPSRGNAAARGEYAVNFSFPRPGEYEVVVDYMLQNAAAPASQSATFTLISKYDIDEDASPYFWHLAAAGFTNF
eukprot:gnl/TRDRNA2_/TRDRNA2_32731_c0_seq1.p1 gnl/TRDRNA2_/TRDRNA2_32731_c0~~gnl/TRDRNA2_/TRDRNA2_32731_c0_seq1.p1  ORF type:complete len:304 (-),score=44.36 gnl/TRDRNA2_/TRDRNA2_32731_c0_seq1:38-949(-)